MRARIRINAVAVAAVAVTTIAGGLIATAEPAGADAPAATPTVVVHMSGKSITLSTGHRVHAGRTTFKVVSRKGDHTLQIARLHNGYTLAQAGADLSRAFSGNVRAIRRVDHNVVFRGGAESRPNNPGMFTVSLPPGKFVFTDQNSNTVTMVTVFGTRPARQAMPNRGRITAYTYGFTTHGTLPHRGWVLFTNKADQPHFVELNQVKPGTTAAQVRRFFKAGGQTRPSWGLRTSYGTGVLTQGQHQGTYLNLPAGEYLMACYWPDFRTGMPHALMGMWKLVHLT